MSRVLVAGVDTSTQSTKVRVTDAETGEMVRFGQAKHPDGTSVNPDAWWQRSRRPRNRPAGSTTWPRWRSAASNTAWYCSTTMAA